MNKMFFNKRDQKHAALRLIELLFINGEISEAVYRNIVLDYAEADDITSFTCFKIERRNNLDV